MRFITRKGLTQQKIWWPGIRIREIPTSKEDGFYQYMAYHIVPGLYYLNEIDSFNYPTLAENMLINVKLQNDVYLNRHTEDCRRAAC